MFNPGKLRTIKMLVRNEKFVICLDKEKILFTKFYKSNITIKVTIKSKKKSFKIILRHSCYISAEFLIYILIRAST